MRTSLTHPLQIAEVPAGYGMGKVGLTFCPGKKQAVALTGAWNRDLDLDVAAIVDWNAAAVVTLVEEHELVSLEVDGLGHAVGRAHMAWYHLPIPDLSTPNATFEDTWCKEGAELRHVLRSGFNVLVHCKGGLGRAGTVASRLLIELGMKPGNAVAALRAARPGAIQTARQLAYVNGLSVASEAKPDKSTEAYRDRALGALVGLAVGDALGTTLEFTTRDSKPRVTEIVGGGPFGLEPGQWTDDTSMALALADSLIASNGLDETDLIERFLCWREDGVYSATGKCFDIGMTVSAALRRFKASGDPLAGSTDPMSAGNGSLMRLAPVAIRFWNDSDARADAAARQSRTTHGAPEAVDACIAYADIIAAAIAGLPRSAVLQGQNTSYSGMISSVMAGSWRGKRRAEIRGSGYVAHSLEAALWCVGRTGTFAEAVILAANLGEDADTTAAITGQLAGSLYGLSKIPKSWLARLAWRERIEGMARQLFEQAGSRQS
ncbi:MAG: ADP-ribosylglycohydrolase family protein [Alphaproteobacteria bacterium]|nr:ADP-ribosylglycohydrolase family protein [Alphaproteobacteria bacterium]